LQIINCAAVPKELADSELFGHVKGAFTGALNDKPGKVEMADGGTLFLDEIGEMPVELQAKLLRFIETHNFERIGETAVRSSNVRIIAATHRNLREQIRNGVFREDLYFRLDVCSIDVPALADHREDIPELVEEYSKIVSVRNNRTPRQFSPQAIEFLQNLSWPGNVRQLLNLIEQAVIYFQQIVIDQKELELLLRRDTPQIDTGGEGTLAEILERVEADVIMKRLNRYEGKVEKAAESLGIHRSSLHRKMTKFSKSDNVE
jgi:DNA-binding NtrC family response regulator